MERRADGWTTASNDRSTQVKAPFPHLHHDAGCNKVISLHCCSRERAHWYRHIHSNLLLLVSLSCIDGSFCARARERTHAYANMHTKDLVFLFVLQSHMVSNLSHPLSLPPSLSHTHTRARTCMRTEVTFLLCMPSSQMVSHFLTYHFL